MYSFAQYPKLVKYNTTDNELSPNKLQLVFNLFCIIVCRHEKKIQMNTARISIDPRIETMPNKIKIFALVTYSAILELRI